MTSHILTHNYYAITSLVLLTIGSFYISNQVHYRWLSQLKLSLMDTNALVKLLTVLLGFSVISWRPLLDTAYQTQILVILFGVIGGFLFVEIENLILRHTPTTKLLEPSIAKKNQNSIKNILSRTKPIKPDHEILSYNSTALVGACEELLYRGFMTVLSINLLNKYASIFCLFIITTFFALSHLSLGGAQVLSKFFLGLICLLSFLYTKTIVTPILIHVTFNTIAVNKFRKLAYE